MTGRMKSHVYQQWTSLSVGVMQEVLAFLFGEMLIRAPSPMITQPKEPECNEEKERIVVR